MRGVNVVGTLRARCRRVTRRSPWAYALVVRARRARGLDARLADRGTKICVEGYPSTGNTLATFVILRCWPDVGPAQIASHRHSPAAVKSAVRRGVPTIVLVREPVAAIASNVVRFGQSVEMAADDYIDFHGAVARELAGGASIAVVDFETLMKHTEEYARVAARLMGRSLDPERLAAAKQEFSEKVRESMDILGRRPSDWALPHPEKDHLKDQVAEKLVADHRRLERAGRAHAEVRRLAGLDARPGPITPTSSSHEVECSRTESTD